MRFKLFWASATAALLVACSQVDESGPSVLSLAGTLGGADTAGYARALEPRDFEFPRDHGPHEAFKTEWWYFTGHLESASGRRFGYQFTLFRSALSPELPESESAWATRQAYMGHFAISDLDGSRFTARERFARGAAGLAGARTAPLRVWLEDWEISGTRGDQAFPLTIRAEDDSIALRLRVDEGKGVVLNGDRGWSPKSAEPGNASYYYSMPRMPSQGTVRVGSETFEVTGSSWLDREWSTSVLGDDQVGWDWFALQLEDGRDLMAYRLRNADGSDDPLSEAVLSGPEGRARRLVWGRDIVIQETGRWRAPDGNAEYPSGWVVRVPSEGLELRVEPLLADQELRLAFRYWEGAVAVDGTGAAGPLSGRGYVELTGYGTGAESWR